MRKNNSETNNNFWADLLGGMSAGDFVKTYFTGAAALSQISLKNPLQPVDETVTGRKLLEKFLRDYGGILDSVTDNPDLEAHDLVIHIASVAEFYGRGFKGLAPTPRNEALGLIYFSLWERPGHELAQITSIDDAVRMMDEPLSQRFPDNPPYVPYYDQAKMGRPPTFKDLVKGLMIRERTFLTGGCFPLEVRSSPISGGQTRKKDKSFLEKHYDYVVVKDKMKRPTFDHDNIEIKGGFSDRQVAYHILRASIISQQIITLTQSDPKQSTRVIITDQKDAPITQTINVKNFLQWKRNKSQQIHAQQPSP